jgi:hypothetical protein
MFYNFARVHQTLRVTPAMKYTASMWAIFSTFFENALVRRVKRRMCMLRFWRST